MITLVINGRRIETPAHATVLDASRRAGTEIPTLCHDERLTPAGACRLCLVRVRQFHHLVPACATPVADGMEIDTHTPEIEETRRMVLQLLAEDYPAEALERWPEKPFHRWLRTYGVRPPTSTNVMFTNEREQGRKGEKERSPQAASPFPLCSSAPFPPFSPAAFHDDTHPYLAADFTRCIDCFRCVRICNEVQGQFVWHVTGRGHDARIVPDGPTLLTSSCVSCGACVDTCPTGALEDQSILQRGVPTKRTRTTCPYCGVGCEMSVGTREGRIVQVKPVLDAPVSKGHLCVKGRYAFDFVHAADRVTEPMIREDLWRAFKSRRDVGDSFPLTPALSPGEREKVIPPHDKLSRFDHPERRELADERRAVLPLPEGEGRGEGEGIGRVPAGWRRVSWSEAIQFVADNFRRILGETGPDSLGVLGSARGTNEENYLAQKFARVVLGTNNVDCCARVCHAPTAAGMKQTLGTGAATNSFNDIEHAAAFLICGCNPTENHPIVGARIKQAVLRGAKLIVIDPREIELTRHAGVHLQLRPGTNVPLLHALACVIVQEKLIDEAAIRDRVSDHAAFCDFIAAWAPERVTAITGVPADDIRKAARLYAVHKPAMCFHGLGMTEHVQGTEGVMCLVNLALLTGNFGKPGSGVNPLRGQNNVQGSAHMGCEPNHLTGYVPLFDLPEAIGSPISVAASASSFPLTPGEREKVTPPLGKSNRSGNPERHELADDRRTIPPLPQGECRGEEERANHSPGGNDTRARFENIWGSSIPHTPGLNLMQMIAAAAEQKLKTLWAIGYDVALTNPNSAATKAALSKLDFVVVQDLFMNELAREFGHVFLPACSSFEKDGTFMNSERRVQRVRKALESPGKSKPDWQIVCAVAKAMGFEEQFDFHSVEEIWNEVRTVWKAGAGISYDRLERSGLQWPCPSEDHPGTTILHTDSFPHGQRAPLKRIEFATTAEATTAEFPFLLTTGRTLYQFNAGTMTMRTPNAKLRETDTLDISPADAGRLDLNNGDRVRVRSRHGEATIPLRLDSRVKPGELFATFHAAEVFLNQLTSPHRDNVVMTPEYKVVAVTVERV